MASRLGYTEIQFNKNENMEKNREEDEIKQ